MRIWFLLLFLATFELQGAARVDCPLDAWIRLMKVVDGQPETAGGVAPNDGRRNSASIQLYQYFSKRKFMSLDETGGLEDALIHATRQMTDFLTQTQDVRVRRHALQGLLLIYSAAATETRRLPKAFVPAIYAVAKNTKSRLCQLARDVLIAGLTATNSKKLLQDLPPPEVTTKKASNTPTREVDFLWWFGAMEKLISDLADTADSGAHEERMAELREVARVGTRLARGSGEPIREQERAARIERALAILKMESDIARQLGILTLGMLLHRDYRGNYSVPDDILPLLNQFAKEDGEVGEVARRARKRIFGKVAKERVRLPGRVKWYRDLAMWEAALAATVSAEVNERRDPLLADLTNLLEGARGFSFGESQEPLSLLPSEVSESVGRHLAILHQKDEPLQRIALRAMILLLATGHGGTGRGLDVIVGTLSAFAVRRGNLSALALEALLQIFPDGHAEHGFVRFLQSLSAADPTAVASLPQRERIRRGSRVMDLGAWETALQTTVDVEGLVLQMEPIRSFCQTGTSEDPRGLTLEEIQASTDLHLRLLHDGDSGRRKLALVGLQRLWSVSVRGTTPLPFEIITSVAGVAVSRPEERPLALEVLRDVVSESDSDRTFVRSLASLLKPTEPTLVAAPERAKLRKSRRLMELGAWEAALQTSLEVEALMAQVEPLRGFCQAGTLEEPYGLTPDERRNSTELHLRLLHEGDEQRRKLALRGLQRLWNPEMPDVSVVPPEVIAAVARVAVVALPSERTVALEVLRSLIPASDSAQAFVRDLAELLKVDHALVAVPARPKLHKRKRYLELGAWETALQSATDINALTSDLPSIRGFCQTGTQDDPYGLTLEEIHTSTQLHLKLLYQGEGRRRRLALHGLQLLWNLEMRGTERTPFEVIAAVSSLAAAPVHAEQSLALEVLRSVVPESESENQFVKYLFDLLRPTAVTEMVATGLKIDPKHALVTEWIDHLLAIASDDLQKAAEARIYFAERTDNVRSLVVSEGDNFRPLSRAEREQRAAEVFSKLREHNSPEVRRLMYMTLGHLLTKRSSQGATPPKGFKLLLFTTLLESGGDSAVRQAAEKAQRRIFGPFEEANARRFIDRKMGTVPFRSLRTWKERWKQFLALVGEKAHLRSATKFAQYREALNDLREGLGGFRFSLSSDHFEALPHEVIRQTALELSQHLDAPVGSVRDVAGAAIEALLQIFLEKKDVADSRALFWLISDLAQHEESAVRAFGIARIREIYCARSTHSRTTGPSSMKVEAYTGALDLLRHQILNGERCDGLCADFQTWRASLVRFVSDDADAWKAGIKKLYGYLEESIPLLVQQYALFALGLLVENRPTRDCIVPEHVVRKLRAIGARDAAELAAHSSMLRSALGEVALIVGDLPTQPLQDAHVGLSALLARVPLLQTMYGSHLGKMQEILAQMQAIRQTSQDTEKILRAEAESVIMEAQIALVRSGRGLDPDSADAEMRQWAQSRAAQPSQGSFIAAIGLLHSDFAQGRLDGISQLSSWARYAYRVQSSDPTWTWVEPFFLTNLEGTDPIQLDIKEQNLDDVRNEIRIRMLNFFADVSNDPARALPVWLIRSTPVLQSIYRLQWNKSPRVRTAARRVWENIFAWSENRDLVPEVERVFTDVVSDAIATDNPDALVWLKTHLSERRYGKALAQWVGSSDSLMSHLVQGLETDGLRSVTEAVFLKPSAIRLQSATLRAAREKLLSSSPNAKRDRALLTRLSQSHAVDFAIQEELEQLLTECTVKTELDSLALRGASAIVLSGMELKSKERVMLLRESAIAEKDPRVQRALFAAVLNSMRSLGADPEQIAIQFFRPLVDSKHPALSDAAKRAALELGGQKKRGTALAEFMQSWSREADGKIGIPFFFAECGPLLIEETNLTQ